MDLEKTANTVVGLIPQLFFDVIARIVPGPIILGSFLLTYHEQLYTLGKIYKFLKDDFPKSTFILFCILISSFYIISIIFYGFWDKLLSPLIFKIRSRIFTRFSLRDKLSDKLKEKELSEEIIKKIIEKLKPLENKKYFRKKGFFSLANALKKILKEENLYNQYGLLILEHVKIVEKLTYYEGGDLGMPFSQRYDEVKLKTPIAGGRMTKLRAEIHMAGTLIVAFLACASLRFYNNNYGFDWIVIGFVFCMIGSFCSVLHYGKRIYRSVESYSELLNGVQAQAVESLIEFLQDNDKNKEIRQNVIEILGEIRNVQAVKRLTKFLKDEDQDIQLSAIEALKRIISPVEEKAQQKHQNDGTKNG